MNGVLTSISTRELERFRSAIEQRTGLAFEDSRSDSLRALLAKRSEAVGGSVTTYLDELESAKPLREELSELATQLTVSETYFFRHYDQFRAFREVALPARIARRSTVRRLHLLSAGCSSGEEPYSLAMLAHDARPDASWEIAIRGIDLNPLNLEKAKRARYAPWALRETPPEMQQRWFRGERSELVLDPLITRAVTFEQRNLAQPNDDLWLPGRYDVVFCRNVLMYLAPETMRAVVARIAHALAPGGFLFLGHAETLRGLSNDFHLLHTHDTFYYQRKATLHADEALPSGAVRAGSRDAGDQPTPLVTSAISPSPLHWTDAIGEATQRIDALRHRALATAAPTPVAPVEAAPSDADAALVRAALLAHGGQHALAEQACRELLALDELSAGAHYLLALCREGQGDLAAAVEQDQVATYLEPRFAMPRLHLGLLAQRRGDRDAGRRELSHALTLLQGEDASRILLFGGGFGREALIGMCRAQLLACGGRP